MTFGFNEADRLYGPKRPVKLECEHCAITGPDVMTRQNLYREAEAVLCKRCGDKWC